MPLGLYSILEGMRFRSSVMKRAQEKPAADEPPSLRARLGHLYLSNALSARQVQGLAAAAASSGASGVEALAAAGASGLHDQNAARDVLRSLLRQRRGVWPELYRAPVPVLDRKTNQPTQASLAFLLPHSVLALWVAEEPEVVKRLVPREGSTLRNHTATVAQELEVPIQQMVPIGLHGDGVPRSRDRTKSLEVWSFNFPAADSRLRVPFLWTWGGVRREGRHDGFHS